MGVDFAPSYTKMAGKSMFGNQELSNRPTPPSYGFGSSTRAHAAKVFHGGEHAKTYNFGADTPGPRYSLDSSMGTQQEGGKSSVPQWAFGTDQRFGNTKRKAASPGPGAYHSDSSLNKQVYSQRATSAHYGFGTGSRAHQAKVFISPSHASSDYGLASPGPAYINNAESSVDDAPKFGFGTAERFGRTAQKQGTNWDSPGPAAYDTANGTTGVGSQLSSRCISQPSFGFGSSARHHRAKLFVSNEHSRSDGGAHACSPGPSVYGASSSMGSQYTTRGHTAPGWGFGKANRFRAGSDATGTPGPGAYAI